MHAPIVDHHLPPKGAISRVEWSRNAYHITILAQTLVRGQNHGGMASLFIGRCGELERSIPLLQAYYRARAVLLQLVIMLSV